MRVDRSSVSDVQAKLAEMKRRKKQDKGRLKQEAQEREAFAEARAARLARVEASACDGAVLEIGADLGLTTAVLAERVGAENVVGVDLAMESVEKARASYPDLTFEQLDIFEEGAAAALQKLAPAGFGRVFIDINGSRMLPAVLEALRPGGVLILGANETLVPPRDDLELALRGPVFFHRKR